MTLYAVWKTKIVVKFDPNEEKGGRFTSTETEIKFLQGEIVKLTTAQRLGLYNISEDENFFVGWSTVKNGLVQYDDGVTLTPDSDMTLYAVWSDGGDGSEGNPFIIDSYNRLKKLAKDTNDYANYFYQGTYFKLTVNIDATSEDWTPIGKNYNYSFNGHFNGGNHFISYKINDSDAHNQGLFGYLDGGSIKNLSIYANITGAGDYVGGIVGFVGFDAVVKNCYTTVNLTSTAETDYWSESTNLGGIAGANWGTIEYCSVFGSLLRDNDNEEIRLGGIAGVNNGGTLSNCASFSGLGSTECYIGMITGDNQGEEFYPGTIENCCYDIIMAGKYKGVGYEEGTKDVSGTTAMTRAQLSAYAKSISDDYALYREGILLGIASGGSDEEFSDTTDFGKSDVDVTDSAIAGKVLDALKKANSAISSLTSGDVYDLITAAYISGDVLIGEQRTSADISEDDKNTIGNAKYLAILPKIIVKTSGVYVFSVPITNMPETTPIVFHSLKQSSGEVKAASSSEQDYIFIDENVNEITTVPSSRNVNVAAYFSAGTYAPVIAGSSSSSTSSKGSSSGGCNAGFGFGLAALLLVPFVKKFKFKS